MRGINSIKFSFSKITILFCAVIFVFGVFAPSIAEAKSYNYQSWDSDITVNKDSTFDVTETITYDVDGTFHAKNAVPYKPVINYRKGQVILTGTAIPTTSTVSAVFSYKHVAVDFVDSDIANLLFSRYNMG